MTSVKKCTNSAIDGNELLTLITNVQLKYSERRYTIHKLFEDMLHELLTITQSNVGFIGVLSTNAKQPCIEIYGFSNKEEEKQIKDTPEIYGMDSLFGEIVTNAKSIIYNEIPKAYKNALVNGPIITNFLGIPLTFRGNVIGVIGFANRSRGYSKNLIKELLPVFTVCGNFLGQNSEEEDFENSINYKYLIQNSKTIILRLDKNGIVTFSNDNALEFFGFSREELLGKHVTESIVPSENSEGESLIEMVNSALSDPLKFGDSINENICKNGERKIISWSNTPIFNKMGDFKEYLSIGIDVTEIEKTRKENEKLAAIVEFSTDFICTADMDLNVTYINNAGIELMGGVGIGEVKTSKAVDFYPEHERMKWENEILPKIMKKGKWSGEIDMTQIKTGDSFPVQLNLFLLNDTVTGEPFQLAGIARDKRKQRDANKNMVALFSIIEATSDLIGYTDDIKNPIYLNNAGRKMLGIENGDELNHDIIDFIADHEKNKFITEIIPTVKKKGQWVGALDGKNTKTGEIFYTYTELFAIRSSKSNENQNFAIIAKDIGEIRAFQEKVIESEKALKMAQKIGKVGSWELDLVNNRLMWSEEIYRLLDLTPFSVEATYETFLKLIHPDDRDEVNAAYTNHIENRVEYNIIHRLLLRNDVIKYVHERCESEWDENGIPIRSLGSVADVTEQKLSELELEKYKNNLEEMVAQRTKELVKANSKIRNYLSQIQQSEENYRFLAENTYGVVLKLDKQMKCTYVSPSIENLTGFTISESIKMIPSEYIHPDDLERIMGYYKEDIENKANSRVFRYRRLKKGGDYIWVETALINKYDKNNDLIGSTINMRDISKQKKAEEALVESQNFRDELFEISEMGLALHDFETGHVVDGNKAFAKIIGRTIDETRKTTYWEITPEKYAEDEEAQLESLRSIGKYGPYEKEYIHKNGHLVPVRLQGKLIHRDGKDLIWSSIEDISDRVKAEKKLEEARGQLIVAEKMASLGVLMAGIAHEINNPVNFVYAGIESLEENLYNAWSIIDTYQTVTADNYEQKLLEIQRLKFSIHFDKLRRFVDRSVANIKKGAERTSEIIKGLETFARNESEEKVSVDIHNILEGTLLMLRSQYKNRITIIKNYCDEVKVGCYPGKLSQVFMNILVNSIQAIPEKGTIIITTKVKQKKNRGFFEAVISDNGIGMNSEITKRIFEPFYTTKLYGKGTGLGLSITHDIVKDHDGNIDVKSKEGEGTKFTIQLPI